MAAGRVLGSESDSRCTFEYMSGDGRGTGLDRGAESISNARTCALAPGGTTTGVLGNGNAFSASVSVSVSAASLKSRLAGRPARLYTRTSSRSSSSRKCTDLIDGVEGSERARRWRWSTSSGMCGADADLRDGLSGLPLLRMTALPVRESEGRGENGPGEGTSSAPGPADGNGIAAKLKSGTSFSRSGLSGEPSGACSGSARSTSGDEPPSSCR
jgi:hypothetical protein